MIDRSFEKVIVEMSEKDTQNKGFRYAYVLGEKVEPSKHLHGSCSLCGGEVFARCGPVRIAHWAHKSVDDCETYSRDMSAWHKGWQDKFPEAWREEPIIDLKIPERHRADILTAENLVIEFQHSPIDEEEQLAREKFYSSHSSGMVWVVDATCHTQAMKRFDEEKQYFQFIKLLCLNSNDSYNNYFLVNNADIIFPSQWNDRRSYVFFDYLDAEREAGDDSLYCLFPKIVEGERLVWKCPRDSFVSIASDMKKVLIYLARVFRFYYDVRYGNIHLKPKINVVPYNRGYYTENSQARAREFRDGIKKANARNNGYLEGKTNGKSGYKGNYKSWKGR